MSTSDTPGVSRRDVFRRGGQVAAGAGAIWLTAGTATAAPHHETGTKLVELRESTSPRVHVSPDGRTIAFDALNSLWLVPIGGGRARRLTDDVQDSTQPNWAPDGRSLVFQSFREGTYDLWTINADGTGLRRLTDGPGYDQEPAFSPDGRLVAFASDRGSASHVWLLEIATGVLRVLTEGDKKHAQPSWSPDGRKVVYVVNDTTVESTDIATGARAEVRKSDADTVFGPAYAPDGRLGYVEARGSRTAVVVDGAVVADGEDVAPFGPNWLSAEEIVYATNGGIRRRVLGGAVSDIPFVVAAPVLRQRNYQRRLRDFAPSTPQQVKGIAGPVLSPDGRTIVFRALNSLWLLPVEGGKARRITDDAYFDSDPDWFPDGKSLVYVSDRAGTANLWNYDLATGASRQVTSLPNAQLTPRVSPDGRRIAYQDEAGATWVWEAGAVTKVLPAMYQPGRPAWSPDSGTIALAAVRPYSRRSTSGHNQVLTAHLASGTVTYQPIAPERSIATRGDDGPVWTDGWLVVVAESLLWKVPVDAAGRITGKPVRLSDEVTDSVSVSGDRVLYLSNGRLRLAGLNGGPARTIPLDLTWKAKRSADRVVVRAGALWDGKSTELRENVDIVLEGDRIAAILPQGRAKGRVVDASALTVMPGMIDVHNHWHLRGRQWGDRQGRAWLAYGVTTSRSPGDPAYQMVETREALAAGTQVGPRFFGTGEALDGTRAYYNFMRTTMNREQLERELDRAQGLEYDLLKSYMRMPVALERRIVERAHRQGVPVTSHYLYPAAITGLDGMEHTGGGNRLGYSRTLSYGAGRTSQDSVDLFVASGMWMSSTTLFASELFLEDRSLIEDERTKVLFPDWEYQRLLQKAEDAAAPWAELYRAWTAGDVDALLRVHRGGGLVACGTDAALDDIGVSYHQNLRVMVKHGFTPFEALTTATRDAARVLGLADRLGTVAPGLLADLVFVDGDPLRDIGRAAAVRQVMVGGMMHTVPDLLAPFRVARPAALSTTEVRPDAPSAARNPAHYWHHSESAVHGCCRQR
ncbi:amidohydrolase family protein [Lentzea californiensis]|uniref:amidohydrolase family protein n=1 Tax=Lentzea californiensis TaxID=438851 RepID=UPI00216414D8|nr:amidohydrolase family protein [Lentzea californiensis]MCR3747840.1 component of the Tol biopolymer transport system [Lentzea californiensis]